MFNHVRGSFIQQTYADTFLTAIRACNKKKINLKFTYQRLLDVDMNSCCPQCQLSIACSLKILVLSLLLAEALGPPVQCRTEGILWALLQRDVSSLCVSLAQLLC